MKLFSDYWLSSLLLDPEERKSVLFLRLREWMLPTDIGHITMVRLADSDDGVHATPTKPLLVDQERCAGTTWRLLHSCFRDEDSA